MNLKNPERQGIKKLLGSVAIAGLLLSVGILKVFATDWGVICGNPDQDVCSNICQENTPKGYVFNKYWTDEECLICQYRHKSSKKVKTISICLELDEDDIPDQGQAPTGPPK